MLEQNAALGKSVKASRSLTDNPPGMAVDGSFTNWWCAGAPALQWIEVDLQAPCTVTKVQLTVSQSPAGETVHRVWGRGSKGASKLLREFKGVTKDGQMLECAPQTSWEGIQYIKIETVSSPSWVAWREIGVMAKS